MSLYAIRCVLESELKDEERRDEYACPKNGYEECAQRPGKLHESAIYSPATLRGGRILLSHAERVVLCFPVEVILEVSPCARRVCV